MQLLALSPASLESDVVHCAADNATQALQITADCVDVDYASPIISSETEETEPVPHRRVIGHFNGTENEFEISLTPKSQWNGRFFQLMYPAQSIIADHNTIAFGVESGGYTVQVSGSMGYRADAAVAKFSRQVAQGYYNVSSDQIYGYIYGGSGGSLKAIGAAENTFGNTFGVWDGCVALIQATPIFIPYNWGIRALGGLILANHSETLIDAIQPGGIGLHNVTLDPVERAVLEETEALGIPIGGWEDWSAIVGNRTQQWQTLKDIAVPLIQDVDPTYADDFWTKDGYAGHEQSALGERFRPALVQFDSRIENATAGEDGLTSEFILESVPDNIANIVGFGFSVTIENATQPFSGRLESTSPASAPLLTEMETPTPKSLWRGTWTV